MGYLIDNTVYSNFAKRKNGNQLLGNVAKVASGIGLGAGSVALAVKNRKVLGSLGQKVGNNVNQMVGKVKNRFAKPGANSPTPTNTYQAQTPTRKRRSSADDNMKDKRRRSSAGPVSVAANAAVPMAPKTRVVATSSPMKSSASSAPLPTNRRTRTRSSALQTPSPTVSPTPLPTNRRTRKRSSAM